MIVQQLKLRFLTQRPSFRVFPLVLFHHQLNSFNPSIALHDGEIYFSLRHSNMLAAGNMRHYQGFNKAIARNASEPQDETSFGTLRIPDWGDSLQCTLFERRVLGLQDIRIFRSRGRWCGLGARLAGDIRTNSRFIMHYLVFDQTFGLEAAVPLPSPRGAAWEKNWVPLCGKDDAHIVYRPSPLDVFSVDVARGHMSPVVVGKAPRMDRSACSEDVWSGVSSIPWSGSSQFVPYDERGHLGVVHRKFVFSDELVYEHAFLKIGASLEFEISKPFHFLSFGIEFCAGLVVHGSDVVMSFGSHNDTRAYIGTLSRADVDGLFSS